MIYIVKTRFKIEGNQDLERYVQQIFLLKTPFYLHTVLLAPVDDERSFYEYKNLLRDNRRNLAPLNIDQLLIVKYIIDL